MNRDRKQLRARVRQGATWYKISNLAGDGGPAEVAIYDEIGYWGITASDFLAELKAITASEINLRLNSPGGEIFDGIAIYNTLRSHAARVTVHVDSLAASIASVIAMAGDRIVMLSHSQLMIHDAMTVAVGNAAELREMAEMLDRQSDNIAGIYAERAGGTVKQWRSRMTAETWYSAAEAVEAGLADELVKPARQEEQDLAARWDLSVFAYAGREAAPAPDLSRPAVAEPSRPLAHEQVEHAPEPEPSEPVELVPPTPAPAVEPVAIDPEVFRAAMAAAAGGFEFDPESFRQAMVSLAGDSPAVPAAGPEPMPEPVVEVTPEPEPEPGPGEVLREVVATLVADVPAVPAVPAPAVVEPEPEPPPVPAVEPGPDPDPWLAMAELFRAGVELAAGDAPSPTVTPEPEPEPDPYDATVVQRALKEAIKQ